MELSPIENNARRSRRNGTPGGRETDRIERWEEGEGRETDKQGEGGVVALGVHQGVHSMGSSEQCPAAFDYNVGRNNRIAHGPLKRLHRLTDDRPR